MSANARFYEEFAPHYVRVYEQVDAAETVRQWRLLLDQEPDLPNCRLLDVGCGPGWHLLPWRDAGFEVHGLDLSPAMLRLAALSCEGARLYCADMLDMESLSPLHGDFGVATGHFNFLNLFTPPQLLTVLGAVASVLADQGCWMTDFTCRAYEVPVDAHRQEEHANSDEIQVTWKLETGNLTERYWVHAPERVERLCREAGFSSTCLYGWQPEQHHHPWCAPTNLNRVVLVARK